MHAITVKQDPKILKDNIRETTAAFLASGLDYKKSSKVYTSGQVSLNYLNKEKKNLKFFHLGPERDFNLFKDFKSLKQN